MSDARIAALEAQVLALLARVTELEAHLRWRHVGPAHTLNYGGPPPDYEWQPSRVRHHEHG